MTKERGEARLTEGVPVPGQRLRAGSRLMIYSNDPSQIVSWIQGRDGGERRKLVVRPSNLEDVFLLLTGTSLEEGA